MPSQRVLIAAPVAAVGGFAAVRTARAMVAGGVSIEDGGGWAALLIAEVCFSFAAVGRGRLPRRRARTGRFGVAFAGEAPARNLREGGSAGEDDTRMSVMSGSNLRVSEARAYDGALG